MMVCRGIIHGARNVTYRPIDNKARVQDVEPGVFVTNCVVEVIFGAVAIWVQPRDSISSWERQNP